MFACLKVKRQEGKNQTLFTKNGGVLLEELVAFSNGRSNPIRHFSAKELLRATNYYDTHQILVEDGGYELYKGSLKDRPVIVKKYDKDNSLLKFAAMPYNDIVIGSQMSVHMNVLKVLGCCLETENPTIVYEFAGTKRLSTCISATNNVEPLTWKCRLKIAIDLANAIAYLHTAFSRPVIRRDIKSSNIILDQNNVPKMTDFGLSISIPEGQTHVMDAVLGRTGYSAPEYCARGYLTEKVDVYQLGMLLFELLSGQTPSFYLFTERNILDSANHSVEKLSNVVDPRIKNEGIETEQLLDFVTLLLGCISDDGEERPTMIEVAKELRRIDQSFPLPC
ncbi:non-functional pseudokinase ZED1-like [Durio zibethinus]|uniref:Non-functional pseudokinase ZED1-like n=1 Tax=Durio zibethinus TaxID=66656 RepID=A0A6P5WVD6_DURZI|nr:non-functional pseudokinase ZED1-like [Durio zibethinus]